MENYQKQFKQLTKLKTFFQDQYCSLLGYNFSPYLWLEELCEEMIEDHLSKFLFVKFSCFSFIFPFVSGHHRYFEVASWCSACGHEPHGNNGRYDV
jgi:hypothetical protein